MGGIIGCLLVVAVDRLMPQESSSAHISRIPVLDFQILCILSLAAETLR